MALAELSDDILLELFGWLKPMVELAATDASESISWDLPRESVEFQRSYENYKMHRRTVLHLSSVNHRFRLLLAPQLFRKLRITQHCSILEMSRASKLIEGSDMLRACLE